MARLSKTGGKKTKATARKASPARDAKAAKIKHGVGPTAKPSDGRSVAELEAELERQARELDEARRQQAATAEILKVINASPGDLTPVFDIILEKAHSLCAVASGSLQLYAGGQVQTVAMRGFNEPWGNVLRQGYKIDDGNREFLESLTPRHDPDVREALKRSPNNRVLRAFVEIGGFRTFLALPLLTEGKAIGRIVAARTMVQPFTETQIALLQGFADQAVIAIQNAGLLREKSEALEQQAASAEILRTIASVPGDAEQSLQRIAETTARLFGAQSVTIRIAEGSEWGQTIRVGAGSKRIGSLPTAQTGAQAPNVPGTVFRENRQIHIPDLDNVDPSMADWPMMAARAEGTRTISGTPLRREGNAIGALVIYRDRRAPFTAQELALQQSFADQAVIAIENARLFNETKEALERQTATGEVLGVISSSPTDVTPVFDVILRSATRLCAAERGIVYRYEGEFFQGVAAQGLSEEASAEFLSRAVRPGPQSGLGRMLAAKCPVQVADVTDEDAYRKGDPLRVRTVKLLGARTAMWMPLLKGAAVIGAFAIYRQEVKPFTGQQIALLKTFADQAVVAIENTRLFNETNEALERQTATADVLGVISRSAGDLAPVFDAMLEKAMQLCSANFGVLNTFDGTRFHTAATHGLPSAYDDYRRAQPLDYAPSTAPARLLSGAPFVELLDLLDSEAYRNGEPNRRALVDLGGARSLLAVPLLKDGRVVGNVMIFRQEQRAFSEKQITLLQQFAAQAVIAIENTRLLNELRRRTDDLSESLQQQTATSEVLKVISRSAFDLPTVLTTLTESAKALCGSASGIIYRRDGDVYRYAASTMDVVKAYRDYEQQTDIPASRGTLIGRMALEKRVVQITDAWNDPEYAEKDAARLGNVRAMLGVPLMRGNEPVGAFALARREPIPFSPREVELITTFADQAVIAIENARLLEEVQSRTRELSLSLEELRAAQDRLVQTEKLASLGQLTAGIAHEIKNPLNFVNNFSSLSAELVDEMNEVLKGTALDLKPREELEELTSLLKSNLEKVVQHGKRADSIVKNMLLHSREGSGEHRSVDVNALVEESLNLAYHGARAEKHGFNITLTRDLDPDVGTIELYPQEITRALLNLISNGFYAASKRKSEAAGETFEPSLGAATRRRGNSVEIRIRDNGAGIPPEVKEKLFNPFFTTKPPGEGTGLGLSMTHDIIVKQHGGRIDVETEFGVFTEFIITLPRNILGKAANEGTK